MAFTRLRFFATFLFLIGLSHSLSYGQQPLGVEWEIPSNTETALQQLDQLDQWGVSALEIDQLPADTIWQSINNKEMVVYGNIGIDFPISATFKKPDSLLIQKIEKKGQVYFSEPSVQAIGLFNYGYVSGSKFRQVVEPIARQLQSIRDVSLYYKSRSTQQKNAVPHLTPLVSIPVTPTNMDSIAIPNLPVKGYLYDPSKELEPLLGPFKQFTLALGDNAPNILFVKSDWIFSMVERYPQFATILQSISKEPSPAFPLPQETIPSQSNSIFPIIALFIVGLTIGLHYHTSPLYRKSAFRYFTSHKFFINDIFNRLIRSPIPALVILVQHALLIAIAISTLFSNSLNPLGQKAFFYHFSGLATFGANTYSIFAWTFIVVLAFTFIGILWLLLSHKRIKSFTQIAIIFAWPLQINFLFCTVVIAFYLQSTSLVPVIFTSLALLLFLFSFVFTAIDLGRLSRSKPIYHIKTTIPYGLIISGLVGWLIIHNKWIEIVNLAIDLT